MSVYNFAPSPSFGTGDHPFVTIRDVFSKDEVQRIINYGDSLRLTQATVGSSQDPASADIRVSKVAWISLNDEINWLYDRMAYYARRLNGQFYKFNLSGFVEDMQYTVYTGEDSGHYNWHRDCDSSTEVPRKLSLVLQLTHPSEYEGGDLELLVGKDPLSVDKELGLLTAFPSYNLHRVTPVTSGTRRSLVVWCAGPQFV